MSEKIEDGVSQLHPLNGCGLTYVDDNILVLSDGTRIGPFSSHWAACAAMIRRANPSFKSTDGDNQSDLDLESDAMLKARLP